MNKNNAIVCLTRGYKDVSGYESLIKRNKAILTHIGSKYPLVIFHEGNISESHQSWIRQYSKELTIKFVDISSIWVGGYESMCRFQSYWIWEYCKEYDNIMRIDEDCFISRFNSDPFDMGDNVYLKSCNWGESHSETNATLPQAIEKLTGAKREEFYNNKFPYTNIGVSNVAFWRTKPVSAVLKSLSLCDDQIKNRWGDLPLLGSLLNIFAKDRVGFIKNLNYHHQSHNVTI